MDNQNETKNGTHDPVHGDAHGDPEEALLAEVAQRITAQLAETLLKDLRDLLTESFDVESVAGMVEQLDFQDRLTTQMTQALREQRNRYRQLISNVSATQRLLRETRLDLELVKRALVAQGQTGVVARPQLEHALTVELFPPEIPAHGAGIRVRRPDASTRPVSVSCESRLPICKAACCRLFDVYLTPQEVRSERYGWDAKSPYALRRERAGCTHLISGSCQCTVYSERPLSCSTYSCKEDRRVWKDYERKILTPELARRLETLQTQTDPASTGPSADLGSAETPEQRPASAVSEDAKRFTAANDSLEGARTPTPESSPPDFSELAEALARPPRWRFRPTDEDADK